jgi:hypothetical protein
VCEAVKAGIMASRGGEEEGSGSAMLARLVTVRIEPRKMEECISIFRNVNGRSRGARPGFDHGHWWADRASREATSVMFWQNETDERASIPRLV